MNQFWRRAVLPAVVLVLAGVVAGRPADAQPAQPTWCADHSDVAIVGTSADTGYGTTGYASTTDTYYPTVYGWETRFANSLHGQWGTTTHNYAHNGALASDFLPGGRWPAQVGAVADMATYGPDLVLVDVGGNELYSQVDPAVFQANLTELVQNIKTMRPGVTILMSIYAQLKWVPNQYSNPPFEAQRWTWDQYASVIYGTAVAQQTALVDMRQYVPNADASPMTAPTVWNSDGIHLNDAGNLAELGAWWGWASSLASIC